MADGDHDHTAEGYFHHGVQLYEQGYVQEALEAFQQTALLDGGTHVSVNDNIVLCYGSLGQRDHAIEQLRWIIENLSLREDQRGHFCYLYYLVMENQMSAFPTDIRRDLAGL